MYKKRQKTGASGRLWATLLLGVVCLLVLFSSSFASAIETTDIIGYWKMDDAAGDVTDSVGSLDGTNNGASYGATGKINDALDLEYDDSDYIDFGADATFDLDYNGAMSGSCWLKAESIAGANRVIFGNYGNSAPYDGWMLRIVGSTGKLNFDFAADNGGAANRFQESTDAAYDGTGGFQMIGFVYNDRDVTFYVNGSSVASTNQDNSLNKNYVDRGDFNIGARDSSSSYYDGIMDECVLFDRALSSDDMLDLWNEGDGLSYPFVTAEATAPTITLEQPTNDTTISVLDVNFTASGSNASSIVQYNYTNMTFFVWDSDGDLYNQTTINTSASEFANETLLIKNFDVGSYTWNAEGCYGNATFNNCSRGLSNYSLEIVPITLLAENYSNYVLEGDTANFNANISILTTERLSVIRFYYNNTYYPTSYNEYSSNLWFVTIDKEIPQVPSDQIVPFFWEVALESGYRTNTTSHNQTIQKILLDNCSSYAYKIFQFDLVDEGTQDRVNAAGENSSIKIDMTLSYLDNGGVVANYSHEYIEEIPAYVCMEDPIGNSSLRLDAVIEYKSDNRFIEFYNIQNYVMTNATAVQNLTLYNLDNSTGQEFKITYKGNDFIPVTDLIVQIQRKYIEEGAFKTIEIPMSGSNGYTIGHLVPNDVIYNFIFIKEGVVLDTFEEVIATCQNPTISECEINLNSLISGADLLALVTDEEFSSTLTYNKTTREVESTFAILSGVSGVVTLNVSLIDNWGNNSACSDILDAAGGTLSCVVPGEFGNSTIYAKVTYDGIIRNSGYISTQQNPTDQYGGILIFSSIILLMFIVGIGISDSPAIFGVFLILGSLILVGLNLVYSTSILGAGASILWFIVAVLVIIIKGGGKR